MVTVAPFKLCPLLSPSPACLVWWRRPARVGLPELFPARAWPASRSSGAADGGAAGYGDSVSGVGSLCHGVCLLLGSSWKYHQHQLMKSPFTQHTNVGANRGYRATATAQTRAGVRVGSTVARPPPEDAAGPSHWHCDTARGGRIGPAAAREGCWFWMAAGRFWKAAGRFAVDPVAARIRVGLLSVVALALRCG